MFLGKSFNFSLKNPIIHSTLTIFACLTLAIYGHLKWIKCQAWDIIGNREKLRLSVLAYQLFQTFIKSLLCARKILRNILLDSRTFPFINQLCTGFCWNLAHKSPSSLMSILHQWYSYRQIRRCCLFYKFLFKSQKWVNVEMSHLTWK